MAASIGQYYGHRATSADITDQTNPMRHRQRIDT